MGSIIIIHKCQCKYIIQLLSLCEGNTTICSPEAGNIARGRMLPSHKGNNCFIMPFNIISLQYENNEY